MFRLVGISFLSLQQQPRSIPAAGFEHATPTVRCLQIDVWDHTTTEIIDVSYYNICTRNWLIRTHFVCLFIYCLFNYAVSDLSIYRQNETRLVNGEVERKWKHLWRNLVYRPGICMYGCREITLQQISDGIGSVEANVWTGMQEGNPLHSSTLWHCETVFSLSFFEDM